MNDEIPVKNVTPVKVHKPEGSKEAKKYTPRSRIYVRAVQGPLENFRRLFGFFFIAIFAVFPWIQYDGHQAILLDIIDQRFTIFSLTLWPQDLTLLAYIFIVSAFALFFVTTFAGRVFTSSILEPILDQFWKGKGGQPGPQKGGQNHPKSITKSS